MTKNSCRLGKQIFAPDGGNILQSKMTKLFNKRYLDKRLTDQIVLFNVLYRDKLELTLKSNYLSNHRMDKCKSFVFLRQYRNCFSRRINTLVSRNLPIKMTIDMAMHDFYDMKTMTFHCIMYQSIPSLTIPPRRRPRFAHSSCPRGRVFAPLSCPGVCPGGLKSK